MAYYLSVDGGGTKTCWYLTDIHGFEKTRLVTPGCCTLKYDPQYICSQLKSGLELLLSAAQITEDTITGAAFGIPCFGENTKSDCITASFVANLFTRCHPYICNDVELGFYGSLGGSAGIHLVAGTGAIAYGMDSNGETRRSNGWHCELSDEGSGYWLGQQTLSLYLKEEDGRVPQSHLHRILSRHLNVSNAEELASYYDRHLSGQRSDIAALQKILSLAAKAGDSYAVQLYNNAAEELALSAMAIVSELDFSAAHPIRVSYSGGVFQNGTLILSPLEKALQEQNMSLQKPVLSPSAGGILLAAKGLEDSHYKKIAARLKLSES